MGGCSGEPEIALHPLGSRADRPARLGASRLRPAAAGLRGGGAGQRAGRGDAPWPAPVDRGDQRDPARGRRPDPGPVEGLRRAVARRPEHDLRRGEHALRHRQAGPRRADRRAEQRVPSRGRQGARRRRPASATGRTPCAARPARPHPASRRAPAAGDPCCPPGRRRPHSRARWRRPWPGRAAWCRSRSRSTGSPAERTCSRRWPTGRASAPQRCPRRRCCCDHDHREPRSPRHVWPPEGRRPPAHRSSANRSSSCDPHMRKPTSEPFCAIGLLGFV